MVNEIGSEFWLDNIPKISSSELPDWLKKFGETTLTSSGRGAITLLLNQINPENKSILLPAYMCESVILPFIVHGYTCHYYEIEENLSPNIESIKAYKDIGVFLHMGYYGFPTNSNLEDILKSFKEQSTIIIEDITHSLFSSLDRFENNDFYIGSIRKWFGIPSGGFLTSSEKMIEKRFSENKNFSKVRTDALINKGEYIRTNELKLKELSLKQFSEAEMLLDCDVTPYRIDDLSINILISLNVEELIKKRKENFNVLTKKLNNVTNIHPIFNDLAEDVCPMFYPILIKENKSHIRKKLTEKKIYCPVHWPLPNQIAMNGLDGTLTIYKNILSIPCDQRYGPADMERIISVLLSIK